MNATPLILDRPQPRPLSLLDQLVVVREMLATLDTWTHDGQRVVMTKVVAVIEAPMKRLLAITSGRYRRMCAARLERLRRQSECSPPDPRGFGARAEQLLALLGGRARDVEPARRPSAC